ncbi:MAG: hypothetical protein IPG50_19930 [Myxococcales bacterium]|nr:hypothetical protein [Myxococcales bacterium]
MKLILLVLALAGASCAAAEKAAQKDPQRCERDPDCASKQGKSQDCATSCADNIACMERCQQIRRGTSP